MLDVCVLYVVYFFNSQHKYERPHALSTGLFYAGCTGWLAGETENNILNRGHSGTRLTDHRVTTEVCDISLLY